MDQIFSRIFSALIASIWLLLSPVFTRVETVMRSNVDGSKLIVRLL